MRVYVIGDEELSGWGLAMAEAGHDVERLPGPGSVDLGEVRPDPKWRDAQAGRTITRHELARAAAHHAAWERVAVADAPALVAEAAADVPSPLPEQGGVDYLLVAGPEPALAYLVTPAGAARLLVTSPRRRLVPITKEPHGRPYTGHFHVLAVGASADEAETGRALATAAARGLPIEPVEWLADGLGPLGADDLVLAVPATALVHADARAVLDTYARLDAEVVLSADEEAVMGPAGSLRALLGEDGQLDPAVDTVAVDAVAELFAVLGPGHHTLVALNGRLLNPAAGTEPLVVTAAEPGRIADLVAEMEAPATRDLVRILRYDDARPEAAEDGAPPPAAMVATELLVVPLWTPEFCATVVRAAEAVGRWGSDPDDPVPGRELSLAAISPQLHRALEEHVGDTIWPRLREHWPSIDYDGIHDAFVVKSTSADPDGLRTHLDLAQVSAAVRLNDGYEGGRLEFPRQGFTNEAVPVGAALVWPSLVTHPHRSTPVTRGVRYGLTIWCRIPGLGALPAAGAGEPYG
jgi:hypothetical protein